MVILSHSVYSACSFITVAIAVVISTQVGDNIGQRVVLS